MSSEGSLTEKDHVAMDVFLAKVLDWYKSGEITRDSAVGGLAHVIAALDNDNHGEAVAWFNQADSSYFKD